MAEQPQSKTEPVKFYGVDTWGRPIFRSETFKKNFFGSTDILFDDDATEAEVLEQVKAEHLLFFGNSFGCEPMGDKPNPPVVIIRDKEAMKREYPYCEEVQQVLLDSYPVDQEDFKEHPLHLVEAAYECCGCVNERVWDIENLTHSIELKFKSAIRGILRVLGHDVSHCDILVEACYDDRTSFVVIGPDNKILWKDAYKAWGFGHHGGIDELEGFFETLADNVERTSEEVAQNIRVPEEIDGS